MTRLTSYHSSLFSPLWVFKQLVIVGLLTVLSTACATTSTIGTRTSFHNASVGQIAIFPFYAVHSFSLDSDALDGMVSTYEHSAKIWLESMGFDVIDAQTLQHHLVELGVWDEFREGIQLRQSLAAYFEASPRHGDVPIEVMTLRKFAKKGYLPSTTLLFGEVVYHSEGICQIAATDHTEHVHLASTTQNVALPMPCVVSHFQAKLVDAKSGETMWFNRFLREVYSEQLDDALVQENVAHAVYEALNNQHGLARLRPATTADTPVQVGTQKPSPSN